MKNSKTKLNILIALSIFGTGLTSCKKYEKELGPAGSINDLNIIQNSLNKNTESMTFEIVAKSDNTVNKGVFTTSGAFYASGDYYETYKFNGKYYQGEVTLSNTDGTISFNVSGEIIFSDASNATGTCKWKMKKCTGLYKELSGNGTGTLVVSNWNQTKGTGDISQSWTGDVNTGNSDLTSAPQRNTQILWSDTYKLLSNSVTITSEPFNWEGTKSKIFIANHKWSSVGDNDIKKYVIMYSSDNTNWKEYPDSVNVTAGDSLHNYARRAAIYNSGTYYTKLKIIAKDNTASYSDVISGAIR